MIEFSASQPFPLVDLQAHSSSEHRKHAACVDQWLGLQVDRVESQLASAGSRKPATRANGEHQVLWFGLEPQQLLTPYTEIRSLLEEIQPKPQSQIVDLGAAYGRLGFVLTRHFPTVHFLGYEFVGERVDEGRRAFQRHRLAQVRLEHCDLSAPQTAIEDADVYFIYDYGSLKAIEKTLFDLRRIAQRRNILVVARGRHTRYLLATRHPWLKPRRAHEIAGSSTIYFSELAERKLNPALDFSDQILA